MKEEQIIQLLEAFFQNSDLTDCFVTEVLVTGNKIMVFADSDTEMGLDRCRTISRYLESHFDETQVFGEKYTLEVSSPGIGKPLKFNRQYVKNIGRKVEVSIKGQAEKVVGILKEVDGECISVEFEVKEKIGKKNVKKIILQKIENKEIEKIIVKISF